MEYAIFDLDGTLLDYEGCSRVAMQRALVPFGKTFTMELHSEIIGTKHTHWSEVVVRGVGLDGVFHPDALVNAYHEHILDLVPEMGLMPGAEDLLRDLKSRGIPIAIATSSSRHIVPKKLANHPVFADCIDVIVTGEDVKHGKPAPDIFLEAAARLGCPPEKLGNCVVFEDSPLGAAGGVAAGMLTVGLPDARFNVRGDRFPEGVILVDSLEQFCVEKWTLV